jgi:hypothetical protein
MSHKKNHPAAHADTLERCGKSTLLAMLCSRIHAPMLAVTAHDQVGRERKRRREGESERAKVCVRERERESEGGRESERERGGARTRARKRER